MTWTDCLFSFIYAFDIFKSPVVLLFNSSKKVPSAFSLMISLSIVLFLMVFFFQSDLFYKKQPISATQTLSTKIRPPIEFNYSNMGFAFIVSDNNNKYYYDPTIFTFVMQYQYYNNTLGTLIKVENKTLQMCQKEDFINSCERALYYFGGIPNAIVTDNLKSAVIKSNKYERSLSFEQEYD